MTSEGLADVLACAAVFGKSLEENFDPARLLSEFSARAQRLIPHDCILIRRREDDGETWATFTACAGRNALPGHGPDDSLGFGRRDRLPPEAFGLGPVFQGQSQLVADITTDSRFGADAALRARMVEAGLRASVAVPLHAGGHVTGALVVMGRTAGLYTDAQVSSCRQLADLIGPFFESVVLLHAERRHHERLKAVTALVPILGEGLKVGDLVKRLGEAVRPVIDFDVMVLRVLAITGQGYEISGAIGSHPVYQGRVSAEEYSFGERLRRGEVVLIRDAEHELDPRRAGDRRIVATADRSLLAVPLLFGERIGGALVFTTSRVHWYDKSDVEVARAIATMLVVAVEHNRLAEHQQQLSAAEARTRQLERQVTSLRTALDARFGFDAILGEAPAFMVAVEAARKVAATATTVLLTGETGTGKEVLARAIHQASARAEGPFVALNCAALAETLIESELFGHERGAFTGADRLKRGRFELAAGGTLFLDEIGELMPAVQAKLLRVLQDRTYERVGGTATLEADARLIAATNRDLERAVAEGRFREDLYYRLAVFRVHLPALRERGEDVLLLADHFAREIGAKMGKGEVRLSQEARGLLLAHAWPGNIRELQNAIERALIVAEGELISTAHLAITPRPPPAVTLRAAAPPMEGASTMHTLAEEEKRMIAEALRRAKGNKTRAAAALGLSRTQLLRRVRRFGLDA